MLKQLSIENYAIIAKVDLDFDKSLNIITGETGAGKSILLGALGLIMGQRADSKVLLDKSAKCIVEATFTDYADSVEGLLKAHDLDSASDLIIRREIIPSGRSRAFVNDTPTNLQVLQKLSLELIDLNQQFQIIEIQDQRFQLKLIDALAGSGSTLKSYQELYSAYKVKAKELEEMVALEATEFKELDYMKFQLNELESAGLVDGEQQSIESELTLLEKADVITTLMEESKFKLADSDSSIKEVLNGLVKSWSAYTNTSEDIKTTYELLVDVQDKLDEIYNSSDAIANKVESNPQRSGELRTVLDTIYTLQKKHGVQTVSELLAIQGNLSSRVANIANRTESIASLKESLKDDKQGLNELADKLTKKRKKVFRKLEKEVNHRLAELAMESAEISVAHTLSAELRADGKDEINILFKANKGGELRPIKKVASGGESARLMLSLR